MRTCTKPPFTEPWLMEIAFRRDPYHSWGFVGGSSTLSSIKVHAWRVCYENVYSVERPPAKQRKCLMIVVISFIDKDNEGVLYLYNNTLVVTMHW